jgi:hypothetical protein
MLEAVFGTLDPFICGEARGLFHMHVAFGDMSFPNRARPFPLIAE